MLLEQALRIHGHMANKIIIVRTGSTNTIQIHSSKALAPCFWCGSSSMRITTACPMCCRGYSSIGRMLALRFVEGFRPWDEYVPHVLERVFVQRTNTCLNIWRWYSSMGRMLAPCFVDGIRPTDEYLKHDLEMVVVHGRMLASCCGQGIRQSPANNWFTPCEYCLWERTI